MSIRTFVGETVGTISGEPRGSRDFYWDTVFIPGEAEGDAKGKTFAEIVEMPGFGLEYKVNRLSQSTRAMQEFLVYLDQEGHPKLWKAV